jgi:Oxidoreductase family, C-terminal alpha/beta domain
MHRTTAPWSPGGRWPVRAQKLLIDDGMSLGQTKLSSSGSTSGPKAERGTRRRAGAAGDDQRHAQGDDGHRDHLDELQAQVADGGEVGREGQVERHQQGQGHVHAAVPEPGEQVPAGRERAGEGGLHRYATPVAMAADAIRAGDLGELVFATWRFGGEAGTSSHPHANLIETQCHGLDMLEHLCGPIDSVTAQMTDKTGRGYSTLVAALHFASGAVGSLVGSYDSSYTYPVTHQLELNGTSGRILVEDTVQRYTFTHAGSEVSRVWKAGYFNDVDRQFHRTFDKHVDELLSALRKKQAPPIHARAGRRALVLALASIESFESGTRVDVPPDDDTPRS